MSNTTAQTEDRNYDSLIGSAVFDNQPSMNIENKPRKNWYAHDKTSRDALEAEN